LPKKIEIDLLLADLALQLGNAHASRSEFRGGRSGRRLRRFAARNRNDCLARPTATAQGLRTARSETIAPSIQILAQNLQLARQGAHVLARQHPADDRELELSTENMG
jgi:hypothetical protein